MDRNAKRKRARPSAAAVQNEPQDERASKRKRVAEPSKSAAAEVVQEAPVSQDAEAKKRKRGRTSNASIAEQPQEEEPSSARPSRNERVNYAEKRKYAASSNQEHSEENVLETSRGSRDKKRIDYGEKRKYSSGNQGDESSQRMSLGKTKDRADKVKSAAVNQKVQQKITASNGFGKLRGDGRPAKSTQAEPIETGDQQSESMADKASKGKRTARSKTAVVEEPDPPAQKRGRHSLNGVDQAASASAQSTSNQQSKRRGRSSNANNDVNEEEQNQSESNVQKKGRGRPSKGANVPPASQPPVDKTRTKKAKKQNEGNDPIQEEATKSKKKSRGSPEPEEEEEEEEEPKRKKQRRGSPEPIAHQRLVPRETKINRDTIETKWNLLPPTSIAVISSLLLAVERPVMNRLQAPQTRALAQHAISTTTSRIRRKLLRGLPFPPASNSNSRQGFGREEDFDLEKIARRNRALESQLTVLGHSNDLLIADRRREEALLEQEERLLERMERGAKEEEKFNRQELRKSDHALLKNLKMAGDGNDGVSLVSKPRVDLAKLQQDADLTPVIKQMQGHLDSMQGNMEQIKGIAPMIAETRAAVEDVLFKHVDEGVYERVVLG